MEPGSEVAGRPVRRGAEAQVTWGLVRVSALGRGKGMAVCGGAETYWGTNSIRSGGGLEV